MDRLRHAAEPGAAVPRAGSQNLLQAAVRRLSILAKDDAVNVRNPHQVAQALQIYGPLLDPQHVDAVRDWLREQR
jgi:hypothetical protein